MSTVAHELRTPLTGLRGYLELILGGKVAEPEVERDFLERSLGIVGSMADLVGDLLELSRLESGNLELEIEPFSVAEAATRVVGGLLPIALECDIRLRTSLPPRLQSATGDRRRVEQILTNLVANALKFTAPGGNIELTARFDGPVAIVAVIDDGAGHRGRGSRQDLRAVPSARGARADHGHRARPADRSRPRPADGRRPGGRVRPGIGIRLRPRPSWPGRNRLRRLSPPRSPGRWQRRRSASRSERCCGPWRSAVAAGRR